MSGLLSAAEDEREIKQELVPEGLSLSLNLNTN